MASASPQITEQEQRRKSSWSDAFKRAYDKNASYYASNKKWLFEKAELMFNFMHNKHDSIVTLYNVDPPVYGPSVANGGIDHIKKCKELFHDFGTQIGQDMPVESISFEVLNLTEWGKLIELTGDMSHCVSGKSHQKHYLKETYQERLATELKENLEGADELGIWLTEWGGPSGFKSFNAYKNQTGRWPTMPVDLTAGDEHVYKSALNRALTLEAFNQATKKSAPLAQETNINYMFHVALIAYESCLEAKKVDLDQFELILQASTEKLQYTFQEYCDLSTWIAELSMYGDVCHYIYSALKKHQDKVRNATDLNKYMSPMCCPLNRWLRGMCIFMPVAIVDTMVNLFAVSQRSGWSNFASAIYDHYTEASDEDKWDIIYFAVKSIRGYDTKTWTGLIEETVFSYKFTLTEWF